MAITIKDILESEVLLYISVFCAFWLPFYAYAKMYAIIKFKVYSLKDIIVLIGCVAALLIIFLIVFNDKQRLYIFSFMAMLLLALSFYLLVRRFLTNR